MHRTALDELSNEERRDVMRMYPRYRHTVQRAEADAQENDVLFTSKAPDRLRIWAGFLRERGYTWDNEFAFRLLLDLANA